MNKHDLVNAICERTDLSEDKAALALTACLHMIKETLARGEPVNLSGFGAFSVKSRAERVGRNPATGKRISIEASRTPAFKPGKHLKAAANS